MTHAVLVLHSAGPQGEHQGSSDLVAHMRASLGPSYDVRFPVMPDAEHPSYAIWREQLQKELAAQPGALTLVGHSLGGSVLLKYLAEERLDKAVTGLFVLAAPYWRQAGRQVDEFVLRSDAKEKLSRLDQVFLYHSRDDEEVPFEHLSRYAALLPQAVVRELDGRGHEFRSGCPELMDDIRRTVEQV